MFAQTYEPDVPAEGEGAAAPARGSGIKRQQNRDLKGAALASLARVLNS